jgi:hypothetical protein
MLVRRGLPLSAINGRYTAVTPEGVKKLRAMFPAAVVLD